MPEVLASRPGRSFLSQDDYLVWRPIAVEASGALSSRDLFEARPPRVSYYELVEEIVISQVAHSDLMRLLARVRELVDLPAGWDSYGARRVRPEAALHALELYSILARDDLPVPTLAPTVSGGVQIEWHFGPVDLELEVRGRGDLQVFFEDESTGQIVDEPILSLAEYSRLEALTNRLSRTVQSSS